MTKRLYIGNLATTTTKQTLAEAFQRDGRSVTTVELVMSSEIGRSRGFAFVEMATESDGAAALQALDGAVVDGKALKVQVAEERKSRFGGYTGGRSAR